MTGSPPPHVILTDFMSLTTVVGTDIGILPTAASLLAIAWYAVMIWESETVKFWFHRRRLRRAHRKAQRNAFSPH